MEQVTMQAGFLTAVRIPATVKDKELMVTVFAVFFVTIVTIIIMNATTLWVNTKGGWKCD